MRSVSMLEQPGWVLRRLIWPIFAPIVFGAEVHSRLREAASRGTVVYLVRSLSYVDFLYFNYAFLRHGLPLARFVNGLWTWLFATLPAIARALWRRLPPGAREEELRQTVAGGGAAMLFLRKPMSLAPGNAAEFRGRLFETLIEEQRRNPTVRLQFVPLILAWGRAVTRPGGPMPTFLDRVFGAQEEPGIVRWFLQFLRYRGSAVVKAAEPLDLQAFLDENAGVRDDVLARRLRFDISGRIERERRVYLGPPRKTSRRLREEVLRGRAVNEAIDAVAAQSGTPRDRVQRRARKLLAEIAANMQPWALKFFRLLLKQVFSHIYDGIDVDEAGAEKVRAAARKGPLLLCPGHRSHVDYLVLSYIFHEHELVPPHIAAGVNLSFFPAGQIFRRSGAFFLRRSFKGDDLYAAVFAAYLKKLLREGYNVEFFIEGTRSRTGKLLPPRTGLLNIIADAVLAGEVTGVQVCPISIGYEKVIEERSYTHERQGGEKRTENAGALLRAGRVLGARYGRLDIEFEEPFDLAAALAEAGATPGADEEARRTAVRRVAHRVVYGISRVTAVTPTALVAAALLASGRRGVTRDDLVATCGLLALRARRRGARFEATVLDPDGPFGVRIEAVDRTLDLLGRDGHIDARGTSGEEIYVIPEERRSPLDYYRNNALHFWSDESLVALCALAVGAATRQELHDHVLGLSRLLKYEFVYRQDGFRRIFDEIATSFVEAGWLSELDGQVAATAAGREPLQLLAGLTRHFIEAYHAVARTLAVIGHDAHTEREAVRHVHTQAERLFLVGAIARREACSRTIYENALRAYVDLGVLDRQDGRIVLHDGVDPRAQAERVARYLEAPPTRDAAA
ncbi:MAG TPA: 1-acyl-sn-glycerol-3-phosphate acyltransferase [Polyangia bacterium]